MYDTVGAETLAHGKKGSMLFNYCAQPDIVYCRRRVRRETLGREYFPEVRRGGELVVREPRDVRAFLFGLRDRG
jgi:hypothetical protein